MFFYIFIREEHRNPQQQVAEAEKPMSKQKTLNPLDRHAQTQ
jgi:hypothetical protein